LSRALLDEHRRLWAAKPVLARVYRPWFSLLLQQTPSGSRVLEVGAGPGFLAEEARVQRGDLTLVSMDVIQAPWNSLAGDALKLPLAAGSLEAILGLDVLHHLGRPGDFLAEAARVLVPGGRLAVVEPWVTPLSFPIYRWLHQEGCRPGLDPWNPFGVGASAGKDAFDGDAAVVWKLLKTAEPGEWRRLGLEAPRVRLLNAFAYLLSLGFRSGSLLPASLVDPFQRLDALASFAAPLLGLRALVVWEKPRGATSVS